MSDAYKDIMAMDPNAPSLREQILKDLCRRLTHEPDWDEYFTGRKPPSGQLSELPRPSLAKKIDLMGPTLSQPNWNADTWKKKVNQNPALENAKEEAEKTNKVASSNTSVGVWGIDKSFYNFFE
jgi:hypothetical protein